MKYRKFLFSFTATALVIAPFVINAEAPPTLTELVVAPAAGEATLVDGLKFHSVVVDQDTRFATIRVTAKNDGDHRISTEVIAALMLEPSSSPMSRMAPMAREIAQSPIALSLAPGESFTKTVKVRVPTDVSDELKRFAEIAAAPNAAPEDSEAVSFRLMASAPALFASIHELPPPVEAEPEQIYPAQDQQAAAN